MNLNPGKMIIASALVLVGSFAPVFAQDGTAPTLMDRLPQNVLGAIGIRDLSSLKTRLGESQFNDAWQSEELGSIRELMDKNMAEMQENISAEANLDMKKIMSYAKGDIALALIDVQPGSKFDVSDEVVFGGIALMEIDPDTRDSIQNDLDVILAELSENAVKGSYDSQGVEVRTISLSDDYTVEEYEWQTGETIEVNKVSRVVFEYGFMDNLFFMGSGLDQPCGKVLNTLLGEAEPKLAGHPGPQRLQQHYQGSGDVDLWVNTSLIYNTFKAFETEGRMDEGFKFLDASGISDLEGLGLQLSLFDGGLLTESGILMPAERRGLIDALYTGESLTLESARNVPADAYQYTSFQLDLGKIWDAAMVIINENYPEVKPQLDMGLGMANGQLQLDVVESFIRRIKGEHVVYQTRNPKGAEQAAELTEQYGFEVPEQLEYTFSIGLNEAPEFHTAMEQVVDLQVNNGMLQFEKENFQDVTLYQPIVDPAAPQMFTFKTALGLTKDSLTVAATREVLNDFIRLSQSAEENRGLYANEEFRSFTADMDKEWLTTVSYSSPEMMGFSTGQVFGALSMMSPTGLGDVILPEGDWYEKHFGPIIAVGYLKPDIYYTNSVWYTIDDQ